MPQGKKKAELYKRYPLSSILTYNVSTVSHYVLGGIGIFVSYDSWIGYVIGYLYLLFSFVELYVLMPVKVCPNCPYYNLKKSLCVSGLNAFSRKLAKKGQIKDFTKRARGPLCANNLYMASLIIPIVAIIPPLIIHFSYPVLAILLIITVLLIFRFFVIFPKIACLHCIAKYKCPQAEAMGVRNL